MTMKKILLVFGTRPEAIKMAPLVKEFQKYPEKFDTKVCVTAQHRQMLDQVLDIFDIKPDYDLNIMAPNQDLYDITSKVLLGMRDVLNEFQPEIVFVHGDTTTSMATAIAAFYQRIKIAHVEAGLRTYNLQSPWPEEMNRQLTDRLCDYCFAPTETSRNNLLQEKIDASKIFVTGNTVIDALHWVVNKINNDSSLYRKLQQQIEQAGYPNILNSQFSILNYILVTGHRRENFGEGFLNICKALKAIATIHPDVDIVYPVHLNANIQRPVLVMRNTTERPEAVEAGMVKLVGIDVKTIIENVNLLLNDNDGFQNIHTS